MDYSGNCTQHSSYIYRVRQKTLTVFKSRYIGNRVVWGNANKVSG